MNNYRYRAVTQEGGVVTGHLTASDHHDLEQRLRGLRLDLISWRPTHLGRWLPRRLLRVHRPAVASTSRHSTLREERLVLSSW